MKQKGFTLIELLVVVAIIGILAAVGVNTFTGFQEKAKKAALKANHKLILKTMSYGFKMCELDSLAESLLLKYPPLILDCKKVECANLTAIL